MPMEKYSKDLFENIAVGVIYLSLFFIQILPLFVFLCVLFSAWQLWKNRSEITKKFKWTWKFFVTSAFALFVAKIFATHYFNHKYGIYPEYLNYSISVWTVITAGMFLTLPILWHVLKLMKEGRRAPVFKSLKKGIYAITLCMMWVLLIKTYDQAVEYDRWLLMLDAYSYSDCKPNRGSFAIRKDDTACYRFIFDNPIKIEMQEYPSLKK
ncbi:hypothetical protein NEISICOT_02381 [Neisseria sicca ATCC 29256]|uniref:Uncharacterized protein n=2 Tax=Neisseria sicca TaxID=490 RepID=C6M774_NEISI|nr:hypothetical protein NEISICOT_02381 [Neisseria sicca ATCC 29256]